LNSGHLPLEPLPALLFSKQGLSNSVRAVPEHSVPYLCLQISWYYRFEPP
jgi:hypothetical protein